MSYQEEVQRYYELLSQGVPPRDAFFNVWPDGLEGTAEKRAKEENKKKRENDLAGTVGAIGGAVATQQAIKHAPSLWEDAPADTTTTTTKTDTKPTTQQPTQQPTTATETPTGTQADYDAAGIDPANVPSYGGDPKVIPVGSTVPDGYTAVGTDIMPDGSKGTAIIPNENIQADGSINFGAYAQGVGGALALYSAYKRYEEGDYVGSGISAAQGAAAIGAAAGSATAASVVPYASYINGSYNAHKAIHDGSRTRDEKGAEVAKQAGLMVADAFTGGLASLGDAAFRSTGWGRKWGNKIDKATAKYSFGAHAIGSVMGGLDTKYTQLKNTRNLIKDAEKIQDTNPEYMEYIQGARQNSFNEDIRKAQKESGMYYAGKYKTFDEYKAGGLEASDLTHVLGNIETFGPEWAQLTEEQRQAVTQGLISADMYISDKGEINILKKNRDKAWEIFNAIKDSGFDASVIPLSPEQINAQNNQTTQTNGDPEMTSNKMLVQQQGAIPGQTYGTNDPYWNIQTDTPGFGGVAYNTLTPEQQQQLFNSPGYRGPKPTGQIDPKQGAIPGQTYGTNDPYWNIQTDTPGFGGVAYNTLTPEQQQQLFNSPGYRGPQNLGYTGTGAASTYPSIREYLASMQQQGQSQIQYAPDFGGPAGQSRPSVPAGTPGYAQPGYAQPAGKQDPTNPQGYGGAIPMPGAVPAQQQGPSAQDMQRSYTMAALERARQRKD